MGKKTSLLAFEVETLQLGLDGFTEERSKYPEHAERVEQILSAIIGLAGAGSDYESRAESHQKLNNLLSRYEWRAVVSWLDDERSRPFYRLPQHARDLSDADIWERQAIHAFLDELQESTTMSRLSRCESCRRFLVGKTRVPKRFCDQKCKQRAFDSKPENRANKQRKMRENYEEHKRREARSKASVGYVKPRPR